jgi:hypothetical protein
LNVIESDAPHVAAMFLAFLPACILDEDSAHRFGSCCEKMAAAVPLRWLGTINDAQIRFMNKRRALECLAGFFVRQTVSGEASQLVVNERQKLLGSFWVARFDLRQDLRNVDHRRRQIRIDP